MTATHRLRRTILPVVLALNVAAPAASLAMAAAPPHGAEFERITADIRAAVERHDARAFHEYKAQLDRLIGEATRG